MSPKVKVGDKVPQGSWPFALSPRPPPTAHREILGTFSFVPYTPELEDNVRILESMFT